MTNTAYITPEFSPSDPLVCRSIQLRPQLWSVLFNELQRLGQAWQWYQDDPAHATVQEVIIEIRDATDRAVFAGCTMIGDVKFIARAAADFELVCDGATYDRVDYPDLYAVLNAAYIIDADHFQVPDLVDRFARGSLTPAVEGGAASVTLTTGQLPPHTHTVEASSAGLALAPGELPVALPIPSVTGIEGAGDPVPTVPPYHTLIPVIMASFPAAS